MKIYISSDMEGITNVVSWEEVEYGSYAYDCARQQMTREVNAVCETIMNFEHSEILVKDAHATGKNLLTDKLPHCVKTHRSWSRDPFVMMTGIDKTFDACILTGYHDAAYRNGNPLAHTMSETKYQWLTLNKTPLSEMMLNAYIAAYHEVPVIMVTGDRGVCDLAIDLLPNVKCVSVKECVGGGCTSVHPDEAIDRMAKVTQEALKAFKAAPDTFKLQLPNYFIMEICFRNHPDAHKASFYPGAEKLDAHTVRFATEDFYKVLQFFYFVG